jgi:mono/diheme cytochrome c family protein
MSLTRFSVGLIAAAVAVSAALFTPEQATAQSGARAAGPPAASFTQAQVESGQMIFQDVCARCHSADLSGGEGPPLVGQPFLYTWNGQPVNGLLRFVFMNMPMSAPGTLTEEQAVNAVAYVLSKNRHTAGSTPLTLDSKAVVLAAPPGNRR